MTPAGERLRRQGLIAVFLLAACAIAAAAWLVSRAPARTIEEFAPAAAEPHQIGGEIAVVEIADGQSAAQIGARLQAAGLVSSSRHFQTLAALLGWDQLLNGGRYTFEPGLATYEIIRRIRFGETSPTLVVIPEGLRIEEIARILERAGLAAAEGFIAALQLPSVRAGTPAADLPEGAAPEGYLFPSTYRFPLDATPESIARAMFQRLDDELDADLAADIAASGRPLHDILVIASLIEREAAIDQERPLISSVIWNRLERDILLQLDSTVQYAKADAAEDPPAYWPPITAVDLARRHPHNTYLHKGLPPTPIGNPGRASIAAAAAPASTNYLFFVARPDRTHAFAETYDQHQQNIRDIQSAGE